MPKPTPEQNQSLAKVTKGRAEMQAKMEGLRAHYEALYQEALVNIRNEFDQTVRDAYDDGCLKEWIKQAYGTKDFTTIQKILDRTPSTRAVIEEAEIASAYSFNDDILTVNYVNHGPENANGTGRFEVIRLEGDEILLSVMDDDTNEDVVRLLDGRDEGFYYNEAIAWLGQNTKTP